MVRQAAALARQAAAAPGTLVPLHSIMQCLANVLTMVPREDELKPAAKAQRVD